MLSARKALNSLKHKHLFRCPWSTCNRHAATKVPEISSFFSHLGRSGHAGPAGHPSGFPRYWYGNPAIWRLVSTILSWCCHLYCQYPGLREPLPCLCLRWLWGCWLWPIYPPPSRPMDRQCNRWANGCQCQQFCYPGGVHQISHQPFSSLETQPSIPETLFTPSDESVIFTRGPEHLVQVCAGAIPVLSEGQSNPGRRFSLRLTETSWSSSSLVQKSKVEGYTCN